MLSVSHRTLVGAADWERYFRHYPASTGMRCGSRSAKRLTARRLRERADRSDRRAAQPESSRKELRSDGGTLFKPLAWQGDLCFGPKPQTEYVHASRGRELTVAGVLEPDDAAAIVIVAYLRAYGPATIATSTPGSVTAEPARKQVRGWFGTLGRRLAEVEGTATSPTSSRRISTRSLRRDHHGGAPSAGLRQYVLGPGRRTLTSCRQNGGPRSADRAAGSRRSSSLVAS